MNRAIILSFAAIAAAALASWLGCNRQDAVSSASSERPSAAGKPAPAERKTPMPAADAVANDGAGGAEEVARKPIEPGAGDLPRAAAARPKHRPFSMPVVELSAGHAATCKVGLGDVLPAMNVTDAMGNAVALKSQLGPRWTLVLLFERTDHDGVEALDDLRSLVLEPYSAAGVRAIAVEVGGTSESATALAAKHKVTFPLLVDASGAALAQVTPDAAGLMPRMFLVDSAGKILWLDLEYSASTRRSLGQALAFLTGQ